MAALLENVVPMKNSTVILASVNARSRTRKAPARQNQEIAHANSAPFAAAMEKHTGMHVQRQLREYRSTMRVNARLSSKRAGESQGFDAPKAKPVWTILPMIATQSAGGPIARGFAKVDSLCLMGTSWTGGLSVHQVSHPGCTGSCGNPLTSARGNYTGPHLHPCCPDFGIDFLSTRQSFRLT